MQMIENRAEKNVLNRNAILFISIVTLGVIARFVVMTLGNNFDFESYKIVGEIVCRGGNVYAETGRYNYGFIFFLIQGLLYKISDILNPENIDFTFRVLIVSVLTLADLGIAGWICNRYSYKLGLIFFLNPISIVITGYHNQFDNIAILLALLATDFVDEENENLTKNDFIALMFLALSLITKHICFIFFIWIFLRKTKWSIIKRLVYTCAPFGMFLLSFVPFILGNKQAFDGIMKNVFLYRSHNNYPFFMILFKFINFPQSKYFILYILIMCLVGLAFRKLDFTKLLLVYFMAMVAFSSAIANQYLIIPVVALVLCNKKRYFVAYEFIGAIYYLLNFNELHMESRFISAFPEASRWIERIAREGGYTVVIMSWILAVPILLEIFKNLKQVLAAKEEKHTW